MRHLLCYNGLLFCCCIDGSLCRFTSTCLFFYWISSSLLCSSVLSTLFLTVQAPTNYLLKCTLVAIPVAQTIPVNSLLNPITGLTFAPLVIFVFCYFHSEWSLSYNTQSLHSSSIFSYPATLFNDFSFLIYNLVFPPKANSNHMLLGFPHQPWGKPNIIRSYPI